MLVPVKALSAVRDSASVGLLAASAVVSATFASTVFIIPEIAAELGVSPGTAGLVSTAQMASFALVSLFAGRRLTPSVRIVRIALMALVVANLASAWVPSFGLLMVARTLAGGSLGALTWLAWSDSAADAGRRSRVAAIGPMSAVVASPLIGWVSGWGGRSAVFVLLSVATLVALAVPVEIAAGPTTPGGSTRNAIGSMAALRLVLALGLVSLGGSAVFVFVKVIALGNVGVSPSAIGLAITLNAAVGIPAARIRRRRPAPWLFLGITATCALLVTTTTSPILFLGAVVCWGFAFWMAVPEVFSLLADVSVHPQDRVGDAQASMAVGRVIGPAFGGVLMGTGSFAVLGLVAGGSMMFGGAIVAVEHRRSARTAKLKAAHPSSATA